MKKISFVFMLILTGFTFYLSTVRPACALIYDYTGNPFTNVVDPSAAGLNLTASVEFYDNLIPTGFTGIIGNPPRSDLGNAWMYINTLSVSCGSYIFTPEMMRTSYVSFTFVDGQITNWTLDTPYWILNSELVNLYSCHGGDSLLIVGSGVNYTDDPGHWTLRETAASVPEPSTLLLIATGLTGFAGFRKIRRNRT